MSAATFGSVNVEVPRGSYGRPLIRNLATGELEEYERASSYGKAVDNTDGLTYWAKCMVMKGASLDAELTASALPLEYDTDKGKLFELAERAMTIAGAGNKASSGTAMHAWTDIIDRGGKLPKGISASVLADLDAYRLLTAGLEHRASERLVVCDELKVAGSFDRLTHVTAASRLPEWLHGRTCIGDLKTGNAEGAIASIAIQLAIYSRSSYYDPETGERTPVGADQGVGLVVHLPLGKAVGQILAVDLELGWQGALAAQSARAYHARAKLACKRCEAGYYKNGKPCGSCNGVARVPLAVPAAVVTA